MAVLTAILPLILTFRAAFLAVGLVGALRTVAGRWTVGLGLPIVTAAVPPVTHRLAGCNLIGRGGYRFAGGGSNGGFGGWLLRLWPLATIRALMAWPAWRAALAVG